MTIYSAGYFGDDCSITQGQQPNVRGVISAFCNIQQSPCQTMYVEATGVLNSPNLTCRIQPQGVSVGLQTCIVHATFRSISRLQTLEYFFSVNSTCAPYVQSSQVEI